MIEIISFVCDNDRRDGLVGYDAAFTRLRSGVQFPLPVSSLVVRDDSSLAQLAERGTVNLEAVSSILTGRVLFWAY